MYLKTAVPGLKTNLSWRPSSRLNLPNLQDTYAENNILKHLPFLRHGELEPWIPILFLTVPKHDLIDWTIAGQIGVSINAPMLACDWPGALGANRCSDARPLNHLTEGVKANALIRMTVSLFLIAEWSKVGMDGPSKIDFHWHLLKQPESDTWANDNGQSDIAFQKRAEELNFDSHLTFIILTHLVNLYSTRI